MTKHPAIYPVPDAVFEQHSAWLATSGAGKTTAVKGAAERMLARGERVVIVDPTGVWWGLRFRADGRRASSFQVVIFGREHADLPLEAGNGEAIARALGTSSTSAILSLKGMRVGERTRFVTDFFETLVAINRGLLNLVVDEIHLFAPQSGGTGLTPAMLHATNNLVSTGRASGLRIAMISQRPAKVHKDSLTQAKSLVALQCSHPLDQRPIRDWLSTSVPDKATGQDIMSSLAGLPTGAGWLSAPQLGILERVRFPMISTFDSSRPGVEEIPLKPLDVAALRAAMSISSPTNEDTKRDIAKGAATSHEALAGAERRGYERGLVDGETRGLERGARAGWKAAATLFERDVMVRADLFADDPRGHEDGEAEIAKALGLAAWPKAATSAATKPTEKYSETYSGRREPATPSVVTPRPRNAAAASDEAALSGPHQRILDALAWWMRIGDEAVPRARACVFAGYSPKASTFGVYVAELIRMGLVLSADGRLSLTAAGVARTEIPETATRGDLVARARALLSPAEARVFDAILAAAPAPIARVDLAVTVGLSPKASTLGVYIGACAGYGLVETAGPGLVRAASWLV